MLTNWIGGVLAVVATVLVQYQAQILLAGVIGRVRRGPGSTALQRLAAWHLTLFVVFGLIFCHLAQVGVWALLYVALGEMTGFADAMFFSLASLAGVSAETLELSRGHRVLGAVQSTVGILMFGWSTALLVALIGRAGRDAGTGAAG